MVGGAYVPHTLDLKHESLKRILTGLNLIICLISGVNLGAGSQLGFIFAFAFLSLYHIRLPLSGQLPAASYGCSCLLLAEFRNETVWSCPFRFQALFDAKTEPSSDISFPPCEGFLLRVLCMYLSWERRARIHTTSLDIKH